jgi:hypothetical protein
VRSAALALAVLLAAPGSAAAASVDYGPISHQGMKNAGAASGSLTLSLQLGLIANQQGIANAVKAASSPTSSSYGKYLSLSTLQSSYGASSSRRNAVVNAFKPYGVTATVDVTHLRVSANISVKNAQKLFGTKWNLYSNSAGTVALPVNTPKLPSGISGNVDTIAGMRLNVGSTAAAAQTGTPTRTGTIAAGCAATQFPAQTLSSSGLFPNQILAAYGIAPLQAAGLKGQGARVAIVGEGPTPANDVTTYRNCFGFAGTQLQQHGSTSLKPILESSLDAMTVSMVAPALDRFDLYVHSLSEEDDDGDVEGFLALLAQPLQATTNGTPLPHVISVSYGVCEAKVSPYTASRTLVERHRRARHHDRGGRRRQRLLGVRQGRPGLAADERRRAAVRLLAGHVAVGAGRRRHEPHAHAVQRDRVDRRLERHRLPGALHEGRGRRRGHEHVRAAPVVAARHDLQAHGP